MLQAPLQSTPPPTRASSSLLAKSTAFVGTLTICTSMGLMLGFGHTQDDNKLPYISDSGGYEPEMLVFSGGLSLTAFLLSLTVLSTGALVRRQVRASEMSPEPDPRP